MYIKRARWESKWKTDPAITNNNWLEIVVSLSYVWCFVYFVWWWAYPVVFVCLPIFTAIYNMIKIIVNEMNERELAKLCEKGRNIHTHKESVGGTLIDLSILYVFSCTSHLISSLYQHSHRAYLYAEIQESCSCLAMRLHFDGCWTFFPFCSTVDSYISWAMYVCVFIA